MVEETKLRAGNYMVPVTIYHEDGWMKFKFGYNKILMDEIKTCFENRKWLGPPVNPTGPKMWAAPITQRNMFILEYLKGNDPYSLYDDIPDRHEEIRAFMASYGIKPFEHQVEAINQALHTKQFVWGAEMGLGKTLSALVACCMLDINPWWVGPKTPLEGTKLELIKWKLPCGPELMTYDGLKKRIESHSGSAPEGIIYDEASRIKNGTAQRSKAAKYVADAIREEHGSDGVIGLLSGTPAPKSPADWWHLCEVARPGFLREGNINLFKQGLAIIEQRENMAGMGSYPHLVTWLDDPEKCSVCGRAKGDAVHDMVIGGTHSWSGSKNEVARLYNRMKGLVLVHRKVDCLDLPEKVYRRIKIQPTAEMVQVAKLVIAGNERVVTALIKLRMLSDGFQYYDEKSGEATCDVCNGEGVYYDDTCPKCNGRKTTDTFTKATRRIGTQKDNLLLEQLELHEEGGRLVVYAGFTESINNITDVCCKAGWCVIQVDGRGWKTFTPDGTPLVGEPLVAFQQRTDNRNIVFVGNPGSAGMGITLTESPSVIFYSNDFNAESRIQAEDRIHRIGMKDNCQVIDFVCLDTDTYVLENLQKKKTLQEMTMTGLVECLSK